MQVRARGGEKGAAKHASSRQNPARERETKAGLECFSLWREKRVQSR